MTVQDAYHQGLALGVFEGSTATATATTTTTGTAITATAAENTSNTPPLLGIWGKRVKLDALLQAGDRLEQYRPLTADPKTARRKRHKVQGKIRSIKRPPGGLAKTHTKM